MSLKTCYGGVNRIAEELSFRDINDVYNFEQ